MLCVLLWHPHIVLCVLLYPHKHTHIQAQAQKPTPEHQSTHKHGRRHNAIITIRKNRYHLRKRKAEQLAELLPSLFTSCTFTEDDVVKRKADGDSLIDWSALHPELNPSLACKASLPEKRASRKRTQIAELLSWATELLPQGGTAVDFCAGSGHVGLVLAAIRPDAVVHIVEKKSQHCMLAQERADKALLKNVIVSCCQLSDFTAPFDVGMVCSRTTNEKKKKGNYYAETSLIFRILIPGPSLISHTDSSSPSRHSLPLSHTGPARMRARHRPDPLTVPVRMRGLRACAVLLRRHSQGARCLPP